MTNLLKNGGFENGTWHKTHTGEEIPEVSVPKHWIAFWRQGEPNARSGDVNCRRPECKVISKQPPFLDPPRIHSGNQAFQCFTFFGVHDAGIYQRVTGLTPGTTVQATAWTHAWSSNADDPHHSQTEGGGKWNFEQFVGIDPNGGTDPWSDSVIWSEARNVYDTYEKLPPVEGQVGERGAVTVFLRSTVQYPFKHSDVHWDDAVLIAVDAPEEPEEPEEPEQPEKPEQPEPPSSERRAGKIGPHIIRDTPTVQQWVDARPTVLKLVGNWGIAERVPADTLIIGRQAQNEIPGLFSDPPEKVARWLVDQQRSLYERHPHIKYWEGPNEKDVATPDQMRWMADLEVERIRLLADMGLKAVIFNFSTGQPKLDLWQYSTAALKAIDQHDGLLGLHEYSTPVMQALTGDLQPPGGDALPNAGWLTLRYRLVHERLKGIGFGHVKMIITECGLDQIGDSLLIDPEASNGAWRDHIDYWAKKGRTDAETYYGEQLLWYEKELRKDDYMVGATVFTEGHYDQEFASFDVAGTKVVDMLTSIIGEPEEPETPAETEVRLTIKPGEPRANEVFEITASITPHLKTPRLAFTGGEMLRSDPKVSGDDVTWRAMTVKTGTYTVKIVAGETELAQTTFNVRG